MISLSWLMLVGIEIPLAVFVGSFTASRTMTYFYDTYYVPYMKSVQWTGDNIDDEYTYYNRVCTLEDFSARTVNDMVVESNVEGKDGTTLALEHGSVIFPNVISKETSEELRNHILYRNSILTGDDPEFIWLISNKQRWSYKIDIDDDLSVAKVLQEMSRNVELTKTMEDLLGPNPSMVELTAITSAYGAGDQHFHKVRNVCSDEKSHVLSQFSQVDISFSLKNG